MRIHDAIEERHYVLKAYMGKPQVSSYTHMHNSIELIYVVRGHMTELFPISPYRVEPGQLAAFYALVPHRCMDTSEESFVYGMHIPIARFLQWDLPREFVSRLTHGEVLIEDDPDRRLLDEAQFGHWVKDIAASDEYRIESLYAELYGRLRRMAAAVIPDAAIRRAGEPHSSPSFQLFEWGRGVAEEQATQWEKLERMTLFISTNYRESITAADVAKHVHVHPNYASSLFHSAFDMTITEYIAQRRLAYAYRALTETDGTILDIALEAGFGSVRRFHHVFLAQYGQTPAGVRKSQHSVNASHKLLI
jgi:AraC-like DNA-binding protein